MKIAFYKAFQPKATLLDVAIATATFGKYSHCELVFENNNPTWSFCFSISPRDKVARFKHIVLYSEQWEILELKNHTLKQDKILTEASKLLGCKYDYAGALFSAIPNSHIEKQNKFFCSEVCGFLLGLEKSYKYSPNELYKLIKRGAL